MKNLQIKKGAILIVALLALGALLLLSSYFLIFTLTESRISKSQEVGTRTYYLAEAGINEAIWRLKNDESWKNNFETNPDWQTEFTQENTLFPNSSYYVQVKNSGYARGEIISQAFLELGENKTARRVVEIKIFKALNPNPVGENAVFTGGTSENISIHASLLNIYDGDIFSNHNLDIKDGSIVNVEKKAEAVGNINISLSVLNASSVRAKNYPPAPESVDMPMLDFDSDDPNSYKNKATVIYTDSGFKDLMWDNQNLTLNNDITYVTGSIELRGGQTLTVNGVLVAEGTINIGERYCWEKGLQVRCGNSQLTINQPTGGEASGLFTKGRINFGSYSLDINIVGLIYANDGIKIVSLPQSFNIIGGIIARKLSLTSVWQTFNITQNNPIINKGLQNPTYSPVVTIEHWEESY